MKADIFVPTSNRMSALEQCLESLSNQDLQDFRVILVGLREDAQVRALIERYRHLEIHYFIQKKKGLIGAANEALLHSTNEIFIRIDDDVVLDRAWYRNLMSTYADPTVGGVTGPTVMSEEGLKSRDLTAYLEKFKRSRNPLLKAFFYLYNNVLYEERMMDVSRFLDSGVFTVGSNYPSALQIPGPVDVSNLEACNWSCRTELLRKIGGYDEIYTKGLGDYHEADAALKIKSLGYRLVFNPKAILKHNVEVGKVEKARPAPFYRIQNFIIFYFRFYKVRSVKQFVKFLLNVSLQNGYYLFRFLTTGKLSQLGAVMGTFSGFYRALTGVSRLNY